MKLSVTLCAIFAAIQLAPAAVVGQVDTFEDGTTQNWIVNLLGMGVHPAPPLNQPSGGPAGAGDSFLELTSVGGSGAGSRMAVINLGQWAGNYTAAGIGVLSMDVRNFGTTDLVLRLLLSDPMGAPPENAAVSTGVLLTAGSGWTNITIPVTLESLIVLTGTGSAALANVTELRIFHNPAVNFPGPASAAVLGVDNITAQAVPEPSTGLLIGAGLLALANVVCRRF